MVSLTVQAQGSVTAAEMKGLSPYQSCQPLQPLRQLWRLQPSLSTREVVQIRPAMAPATNVEPTAATTATTLGAPQPTSTAPPSVGVVLPMNAARGKRVLSRLVPHRRHLGAQVPSRIMVVLLLISSTNSTNSTHRCWRIANSNSGRQHLALRCIIGGRLKTLTWFFRPLLSVATPNLEGGTRLDRRQVCINVDMSLNVRVR